MPSARAPPIVAISSAVVALTARGSHGLQLVQERRRCASPRTCRGRCCWRRRRCRGRARRRRAGRPVTGAVPLASFMLLSGLCETPTPRAFSSAMSASRHPHAVRGQHAGPEEAEAVEIRHRRRLEALLRGLHLVARLGEMNQRRHAVPLRQLARGRQRRAVERVHRVRRHRRRDQRIVLERRDERLGAGQRRRPASWRRRPGTG